jgi:hypothetical protein
MSTESLLDAIENYKVNYYQVQGKNSFFFKKTQKLDCAKEISQKFDLVSMINTTIYSIPDTNKIIFNYPVFKLYANPDNYEAIVQGVLNVYDLVLDKYKGFEAHVILDGFTISAAERYKDVIKLFCQKCMNSNNNYAESTQAMHIYYTPSMIESISTLFRPFIDPSINKRMVLHSKNESEELIKTLMSTNYIHN